MKTFETISQFIVPSEIAEQTDDQLREAGRQGAERFVLWSGVRTDGTFTVRTAHTPDQTAYRLASGLCVRVAGEALHRLNLWLFNAQEQLAVQVHSHPTEAYHSETDDAYAMVTLRGGLSIVVPDFGNQGVRGAGVAIYRLGLSGWEEVTSSEACALIRFTENPDGPS